MMLPNILTVFRILLIIPITALFFVPENLEQIAGWSILVLYVIAGVTDYLDGYLARTKNQMSLFGKVLDPIADKLLVGALLFLLVAFGRIEHFHIIAAIIIILRELLVSGLREFLAAQKIDLPVSTLAKWKTTIQMLALGFLIPVSSVYLADAGLLLLWLAAGLTIITGAQYVRLTLTHIKKL